MNRHKAYRPKGRRDRLGPIPPGLEGPAADGADVEATRAFPALAAHGSFLQRRETRGLGDVVASFATPIARALRLSCIDPATGQLRPESGCAKRKAALNRIRLP